MTMIATKDNSTPLWNQNGGSHGASPFTGFQLDVVVTNVPTDIPNRGKAYRLTTISNAFVLLSDLVITPAEPPPDTNPSPDPDPLPEVQLMEITFVEGKVAVIMINGVEWKRA